MSIRSFSDKATQDYFLYGKVKTSVGWRSIEKSVRRKLDMLEYAADIVDLRSPPGNRLQALAGSLKGFYSIRVNNQWRIIFRWSAGGALDVKVCDYH
jgi:toxin HigB-1